MLEAYCLKVANCAARPRTAIEFAKVSTMAILSGMGRYFVGFHSRANRCASAI